MSICASSIEIKNGPAIEVQGDIQERYRKTVCLATLAVGAGEGWASPYMAELTAPNSTHPLKLTSLEASWVISVNSLGLLFGVVLGAAVQDFIGRKRTLLIASVPLAVGWSLIVLAPNVSWLYASRVVTGFAKGMMLSAYALFIAEIANPMIRGSLIILVTNALSVGALLGTIIGGLLPIEIFTYVCIVLCVLFFVSFIFVPESPYYLIAKGNVKKAEESLKWYNKNVDVMPNLQELQDFVRSTKPSIAERFNEFKKREHLKNMFTILCINAFVYGAGHHTTPSYAETILRDGKIDLTPSVVVMSLSFSAIIAGTIALVLVDKFGRRVMLIGSGLGVGIGHILLGSHFHMLSIGIHPESISWLPVFSLFLVYFSIPCGLSTGPDTLISEVFPTTLKTSISFMFFAISGVMTFGVAKSFQPLIELVGYKYIFWTFATSALCSVVVSYFFVPETARMSLVDIQKNLKNGNNATQLSSKHVEKHP